MPFRVKLVKSLPSYINARVAYLCVPGPRTQLWVIDPAKATEWGIRDDAVKAVAILQIAKDTYEIEEVKSKPVAPVKRSIFD